MHVRAVQLDCSGLRCAVCHGGLEEEGRSCGGCRTRCHADCLASLGRCPTLGCSGFAGRVRRRRPAAQPLRADGRDLRAPLHRALSAGAIAAAVLIGLGVVSVPFMGVAALMCQPYHARTARVAADMEQIGNALELFRVDTGRYPATLDELWTRPADGPDWAPEPYLEEYPPHDPWGNCYAYRQIAAGRYELTCYGADGAPGGDGAAGDITSPGGP